MYHERTQAEQRRQRTRRIVVALVCLLVLAALAVGIVALRDNARAQGAVSIRESVLACAMQCYAIEGSYPSSLAHLEDVYGLTINHDEYVVNYEWFADNIPPSVAVIAR